MLLQKLANHVTLELTPLLTAIHMIRGNLGGGGSGHAKSLSGLCIGDGVGVSKGEGKGHVVNSRLSSSFICSSVFITATCEGSQFPMY